MTLRTVGKPLQFALLGFAGLMSLATGTASATTVSILPSSWYGFDVDDSTALTSDPKAWIDLNDGSALSFTFATAQAGTLTLVGLGDSGATFNVSVMRGANPAVNYQTSSVDPVSTASRSLNDEAGALTDPLFTRGFIDLAPGTYTITGSLLQAPIIGGTAYNAATGALEFTPVPLPAALPLLLSGLASLGFGVRRRST